jgi:hypothetical protein
MDGARFDRLAASWAKGHSRRGVLSLLAALALSGGLGQRHGAISAQGVDAERGGCQGRCAQGQRCKHGACLDRCSKPGTCSDGGSGGGPPTCGPAGANCACVKLGSGGGYCLAASESTSNGDGCISPGCQHNRDCPTGQVCARVPGCCEDKPRICAIPCPGVSDECTGVADGTPCGGTGSGLRCCGGACPNPTCLSVTGTGEGSCCTLGADCATRCCTGRGANGCAGCGGGACCAGQVPTGGPCGRDTDCPGGQCVCGTCPPL